MKVFKFGGASVKDAAAVENVARILKKYENEELVVVISAMGKTTNALERVLDDWVAGEDPMPKWEAVRHYHREIAEELKQGSPEMDLSEMESFISEAEEILSYVPSPAFDFEYDRLVSFGELLSTSLIEAYLSASGLKTEWVDVRHVIRTDSKHREAKVDWDRSERQTDVLKDHFADTGVKIIVTQGFIAADKLGNTTTLGREGSDYTGAILANLLNAKNLTIWKDVPGMLNADPKWFKNTIKLNKISFREAIELSYYGASVIHPKTIQPIQKKDIDLHVKSFVDPDAEGTIIQSSAEYDALVPSFIFKPDQWLVSISPKDFSFIVEEHLTEIFEVLADLGIKINLMQNSAISFSFCIDADERKMEHLLARLSGSYRVKYNTGLQLMTVRHYDDKILQTLTREKEILVDQRSRSTVRMILREREVEATGE